MIRALAILLMLISCGSYDAGDRTLRNTIAAELERIATRKSDALVLSEVADFEWDAVHLFLPFTRDQEIADELGFAWPGANKTGIAHRDDAVLLVFTSEGHVSRFVVFPRRLGDFSEIELDRGLARGEARFRVELDGERMVVHLAEAGFRHP